jgi:hypothetical protein
MTVRSATGQAAFKGVDSGGHVPSVQRWSAWSARRATNRRWGFLNNVVRFIPVEAIRIHWEEFSKGRGYESCDYVDLPVSQTAWEMPVKAGDQITLLPK